MDKDQEVRDDNDPATKQSSMNKKVMANLFIALEAVFANKLRTLLTALGIIFGVAAVIAMLAIGNGAQQEILEQIKLVGVNNIVIKPIVEQTEEDVSEDAEAPSEKKKYSPGLTLRDVKSIGNSLYWWRHGNCNVRRK